MKDVHGGEVDRNHLENVGVRDGRVIEARSIDESDELPVQLECVCGFDLGRARPEALTDCEVRVAQKIDKLLESQWKILTVPRTLQ